MKLLLTKWLAPLVFSLLWVTLLGLTWVHGWPYLAQSKYIQDIQYTHSPLSLWYISILALACGSFLFLLKFPWDRLSWRTCWGVALAFATLSCFSLPVNTGDFFSYIEFGRMIAVHGLSPYLHGYSEIHDIYSGFSWFGRTSNYGPLALLPTLPAAWLSEYSVYASFVALKLTWLLLAFMTLFCVFRSLAQASEDIPEAKKWFMLFALNPLWLLEIFVNGHNDIVGIWLLVLTLSWLQKKQHHRAAVVAAILPLFKFPLGAIAAFLSLSFVRRQDRKGFIISVGATALGILLLLATLAEEKAMIAFFTQSAPLSLHSQVGHLAWVFQTYFLTADTGALWSEIIPWLSPACATGILLLITWQSLLDPARVRRSEIERLGLCLWFLVFVFATQFWPWYGLWVLPFVIFIRRESFFWLWVLSSFGGLVIYSSWYWQILIASEKEPTPWGQAIYFFGPTIASLAGWLVYRYQSRRFPR